MKKTKKFDHPLLNYENKWVALNSKQSKVILHAKSLPGLLKKIKSQNKKDLVVTKVMSFHHYYAPYGSKDRI
jgi:hypothetical protein